MTSTKRWEPPFHAAVPRVGEADHEYSVTDSRGITSLVRTDAAGFLWPTSAEEVQIADAVGLKVASEWTFPTTDVRAAQPALADLTVAQLRQQAEAMGLRLPPRAPKPEVIAAIVAASASDEDDEPEDDQAAPDAAQED